MLDFVEFNGVRVAAAAKLDFHRTHNAEGWHWQTINSEPLALERLDASDAELLDFLESAKKLAGIDDTLLGEGHDELWAKLLGGIGTF